MKGSSLILEQQAIFNTDENAVIPKKLERNERFGFPVTYIGTDEILKIFNKGEAYYDIEKDRWIYRPLEDKTSEYVVNWYNLAENVEYDDKTRRRYVETTYHGLNKEIQGKAGRAYITDTLWDFRPTGKKEMYRVNKNSLDLGQTVVDLEQKL